jgi:hypothetical protein
MFEVKTIDDLASPLGRIRNRLFQNWLNPSMLRRSYLPGTGAKRVNCRMRAIEAHGLVRVAVVRTPFRTNSIPKEAS